MFLLCIFNIDAQTYNYSYTDPCTGNLKTIVVPSQVQNYFLNKNSITFESYNASQLGNYVTKIKSFRKPDIYKGKGLHIKNQKVLVLKPLKKK